MFVPEVQGFEQLSTETKAILTTIPLQSSCVGCGSRDYGYKLTHCSLKGYLANSADPRSGVSTVCQ